MKQLTTVTIIFLPLTFITGFFGQNFPPEGFPDLNHGIWYLWVAPLLLKKPPYTEEALLH